MTDRVLFVESGTWLVFNDTIYNCAMIFKAVRTGQNVTLTFSNNDVLVIPAGLARKIFVIG